MSEEPLYEPQIRARLGSTEQAGGSSESGGCSIAELFLIAADEFFLMGDNAVYSIGDDTFFLM